MTEGGGVCAVGLLLVCACGAASSDAARIRVEGCTAHVFANGAGAAYCRIVNRGDGADVLMSAESPWAQSIELHDLRHDGDIVEMRELTAGLRIDARANVELVPGGRHFMLRRVVLQPGAASVPLALHFANSGVIKTSAVLRSASER
jgi:copper(I)-binding protein